MECNVQKYGYWIRSKSQFAYKESDLDLSSTFPSGVTSVTLGVASVMMGDDKAEEEGKEPC